jgi:hypothetical protein
MSQPGQRPKVRRLNSPCEQAVTGLDAIKQMWDAEREGPDEVFSLSTDILAVDEPVAVVRAEVRLWGAAASGIP